MPKNSGTRAFLRRHPYCCFCGGATPSETRDHVPSKQMFSLRRRPKGLEVPACKPCNNATRLREQEAALLGRIYSDGATKAEQDELRAIFRAVSNNNPGFLTEMMPSSTQIQKISQLRAELPSDAAALLSCSGPLVNQAIQTLGAKLGLALHYICTNRIVPASGGVIAPWYSNLDARTEGIPNEIVRMLGPAKTLRQGRWDVGDQFSYSYAISPDGETAAYFSTFRKSFAVVSWVGEDASVFAGVTGLPVHRPGRFLPPKRVQF